MRIHSDVLTTGNIITALVDDHIAPDIELVKYETLGSRSRARGFEVQLGTYDKTSGPTKSRHFKNTGTHGADSVWAATYDEWGWFLSNLFDVDPNAIANQYHGRDAFHALTEGAYKR